MIAGLIDFISQAGHLVTVFERDDAIGGLLQYGIPTMKLSRSVIQRRVDLLEQEGIIFRKGINVGKDVSAKVISQILAFYLRFNLNHFKFKFSGIASTIRFRSPLHGCDFA